MKLTVKTFPTSFAFALYIAYAKVDTHGSRDFLALDDAELNTVILKNSFLVTKSKHFNKMVEILQSGIINPYPEELLMYGDLDENVFNISGALTQLKQAATNNNPLPKTLIINSNLIFHVEDRGNLTLVYNLVDTTQHSFQKMVSDRTGTMLPNVAEKVQDVKLQLNVFYAPMLTSFSGMRRYFLQFENGLTENLNEFSGLNSNLYKPLKTTLMA